MDLKIEAEDLKVMLKQLGYVKVIQCKDCKYSVDEYGDGDCYCDYNRELRYIKEWDHYCGWAERKEE